MPMTPCRFQGSRAINDVNRLVSIDLFNDNLVSQSGRGHGIAMYGWTSGENLMSFSIASYGKILFIFSKALLCIFTITHSGKAFTALFEVMLCGKSILKQI